MSPFPPNALVPSLPVAGPHMGHITPDSRCISVAIADSENGHLPAETLDQRRSERRFEVFAKVRVASSNLVARSRENPLVAGGFFVSRPIGRSAASGASVPISSPCWGSDLPLRLSLRLDGVAGDERDSEETRADASSFHSKGSCCSATDTAGGRSASRLRPGRQKSVEAREETPSPPQSGSRLAALWRCGRTKRR